MTGKKRVNFGFENSDLGKKKIFASDLHGDTSTEPNGDLSGGSLNFGFFHFWLLRAARAASLAMNLKIFILFDIVLHSAYNLC